MLNHLEAEQACLGAMLLDPASAIPTVMEILQGGPDDFSTPSHKLICAAIFRIADEQVEPVDIVTVSKALAKNDELQKIGGAGHLKLLKDSCPTAANVDHYANFVANMARARQAHGAFSEAAVALEQHEDVSQVIDDAEQKLRALEKGVSKGFTPIKDVLLDTFDRLEFLQNNNGAVTGISSGYPDLDKMTNGFQRSDLIILAARPAVGKTAFALNVAQNVAARANQTVAVFSLEMPKEALVQRMLCAEANVEAGHMRSGNLDEDEWPRLVLAVGTLSEAPLFIDDTAAITVAEIRRKCRRLKAEHGLGLVMIDYLQLISGSGRSDNRQQEVSDISRTLKLLARELDCAIIALSQLSRAVESRADKRPMMSDLRESGSIEQDADIVSFLYRDDYYNPETERKNIVEFIIAKQRSGPTGTVELVFLKNYNKFVALAREPSSSAV